MKIPIAASVVAALLCAAPPSHADAAGTPAWRSMIAAERAFAADARRDGISPAFLRAYAKDGILFTPPIANGPDYYGSHNVPGRLEWAPEAGEISAWGDFGYDYGAFAVTPPNRPAPAAGGHYLTVWERDESGTWKVAVDDGISHAIVPLPTDARVRGGEALPNPAVLGVQRNTRLQSLQRADRALVRALIGEPATAFNAVRSADCVFLREGHEPLSGAAADAVLTTLPARGLDSLEITRLAFAGDLAFTVGVAPNFDAKHASYYVRVWRHTEAGWRLAVDMTHY